MDDSATTPRKHLRVAVVVQRYGLDVNGGAELHARLFVERTRGCHDVQVLTTCAKDYTTWDSYYPAGPGSVDGVPILRFAHPPRGHSGRAKVPMRHLLRYRMRRWLSGFGVTRVSAPSGNPATDGQAYLERQGPFCPDLIAHLEDAAGRYDVVVFFTALYYPTAAGLPPTPVPTVLVPTLHDERSMYHPAYREVFAKPKWILWNCEAERQLATQLYGPDVAPGSICGVGIDCRQPDPAAGIAVRTRFAIDVPYFVFVGRVTRSKGFDVLASAYARLAAQHSGPIQLVVIGQGFMKDLPQTLGIVYTGFLGEVERDALMAGALATVVTSKHESLSLVTLESLALGTPVVVNGRSDVLRAHVEDSGAGLVYEGPHRSLLNTLREMAALPAQRRSAMGAAGVAYVAQRYTWGRVQAEWLRILDRVAA